MEEFNINVILVFALILTVKLSLAWHVYDDSITSNESCQVNKVRLSDHSNKIFSKVKLWQGFLLPNSSIPSIFLHGLSEALYKIWKNQNPVNCTNAKYIISAGQHLAGFGSEIHVEGAVLGLAMKMGRVLIDVPYTSKSMSWKFENKFCEKQHKHNKECYFLPWSNCTIDDALQGRNPILVQEIFHGKKHDDMMSIRLNDSEIRDMVDGKPLPMRLQELSDIKVLIPTHTNTYKHGFIPESLEDILKCSPVKKRFWYYWWRAISATYLLRPNKHTLSWLDTHRTLPLADNESCVAVYVRRGDKAKEMRLVSFTEYSSAAELMWSSGMVPGSAGRPTGTMFFSSEDPDVLAEAKEWAKRTGWRLLYTDVVDRNKSPARLRMMTRRTFYSGLEEEYLAMILNLEYALRCDAWVCTLASNFCRLIDELRTTVAGKADGPFADLSAETCSSPPCIGKGIKSFDW